jgi:uncharacterized protein
MKRKGFTLIELLVVMIMLAVFVTFAVQIVIKGTARAAGMPERGTIGVNDFAGVMSKESILDIGQKCEAFKSRAEIAVVTVASLDGDTIENYANTMFKKWGIGAKGKDNGVLILIAVKERKFRIEVGYGLEPVLPDSICKRIQTENMIPHLKKQPIDYSSGMKAGVDAVVRRILEQTEQRR